MLFGLEGNFEATNFFIIRVNGNGLLLELDTFANESDVMWRGFVASAIAAVSLQWVNPFGTAKLVLFQVNYTFVNTNLAELTNNLFQVTFVSDSWRAFELVGCLNLFR